MFKEIVTNVSDKMFCHMFLIKRESFFKLCDMVKKKFRDKLFKSEHTVRNRQPKQTHKATKTFYGGQISGEVKITMFLRMLAGVSYLDLFLCYNVAPSKVYSFFHDVLGWIKETFLFPLVEVLRKEDKNFFETLSTAFSFDLVEGGLSLVASVP